MSAANQVRKGLAVVVLTLAAAALGTGFAFWRAGPDLVVMTLVFGGSGIYLLVEGLGLLILSPRKPRKATHLAQERSEERREPQRPSQAA
jgi:hypothetical protein